MDKKIATEVKSIARYSCDIKNGTDLVLSIMSDNLTYHLKTPLKVIQFSSH